MLCYISIARKIGSDMWCDRVAWWGKEDKMASEHEDYLSIKYLSIFRSICYGCSRFAYLTCQKVLFRKKDSKMQEFY
jgi:hypothetical protein